jgi:DNA-binding GntR family transcriptional regulator
MIAPPRHSQTQNRGTETHGCRATIIYAAMSSIDEWAVLPAKQVGQGLDSLPSVPPSARVYDYVYLALRRGLASGDICAGTRLVESDLAERMNVSRTPVREALRRLESDGFVRRSQGRGLVVAPIGPNDVSDIARLRAEVDGLAAELASERSGPGGWAPVEECIDRMYDAGGHFGAQSAEFHQAHVAFHRAVYHVAFSPRLATYLENHLLEYIETSGLHYLGALPSTTELVDLHRELLKAMTSGDPSVAADAAESHARLALKPPRR